VIRIDRLDAEQQGRLREILIGRSDFETFAVDASGRRLSIWVMADSALKTVEDSMGVRPTPPPEPQHTGPPIRKVPITTGARAQIPPSAQPVRPDLGAQVAHDIEVEPSTTETEEQS
jgi:hypothetical protein